MHAAAQSRDFADVLAGTTLEDGDGPMAIEGWRRGMDWSVQRRM